MLLRPNEVDNSCNSRRFPVIVNDSSKVDNFNLLHLRLKVDNFNLLHLRLAPVLGVTLFEFWQDLRLQKTKSRWAIMWHCLCDPTFSRFSRTPACDRQTHDYGIYLASMVSRGKSWWVDFDGILGAGVV